MEDKLMKLKKVLMKNFDCHITYKKLDEINKILEEEYGITMKEEDIKPYEENPNILFNAYADQEYEKDFFDHKSFVAQTFPFKRKHFAKMRR